MPFIRYICDHAGEPVDECYTLCTWCWRETEEIVAARSARGRQDPPPSATASANPATTESTTNSAPPTDEKFSDKRSGHGRTMTGFSTFGPISMTGISTSCGKPVALGL